jgi:hypothetical protein
VHPIPLLEALQELKAQGNLEWYEYGKYNTTIKLTKHSGLDMIIKEASTPVANNRPFVRNKIYSEQTNARKIKK